MVMSRLLTSTATPPGICAPASSNLRRRFAAAWPATGFSHAYSENDNLPPGTMREAWPHLRHHQGDRDRTRTIRRDHYWDRPPPGFNPAESAGGTSGLH